MYHRYFTLCACLLFAPSTRIFEYVRSESLSEMRYSMTIKSHNDSSNNVLTKVVNVSKISDSESEGDDLWYEKIPIPSVAVATSKTLPEGTCKNQLQRYLADLRLGKMWATQMYDSSSKIPTGVLYGNTRDFGNFDECYEIDVNVSKDPGDEEMKIQGRYCLVDFDYRQKGSSNQFNGKHELDFDPNDSVWEAVREREDFRRVRRYLLQMAMCVPAACSAEDVETALRSVYDEYGLQNNLDIKISIDPRKCQTREETPALSNAAKTFITVIAIIIGLVIIATISDRHVENKEKSPSKSEEMLMCFSARRNLKTIFEVSYRNHGMDALYLLRFFFTSLVMVGHRAMVHWLTPVMNARYIEELLTVRGFILAFNGTIVVDGFFGVSGMLTCYGLLTQLDKTKRANFLGFILLRFIRFTPAYAFAVFFYALIFPYFGTGPLWKSKIALEAEHCATHWWTNLFYLNNYVKAEEMCMFQSWYLSADFQYYIISLFIIYLFWKMPRKLGYLFLSILTFISAAVVFYMTYVYRIQPLHIGFLYLRDILEDEYFLNHYIKAPMRFTPYLVGVISGAFLYDCNFISWRIPKVWAHTLFFALCAGGSIVSQNLGFKYLNPNTKASQLDTALYASIHRGAFAGSFCCGIILLTIGKGLDIQYNFCTPGWVQPLGRLCYSVFLVHNFIHLYDVGTTRTSKTYSVHSSFWNFIPDTVYSFSFALLISICIEGPFRRIEKLLLSTKQDNNRRKSVDQQENGVKKSK